MTARPNIVVLISDDQGPWALGCAGNPEIATPHLDRLAAEGARLDRFYCVSPVCSPARASLLTGQMPSRHGVHDALWADEHGPGSVPYLRDSTGYSAVLSAAGYRCGMVGKWHLGASGQTQQGFEHWTVLRGGGGFHRDPVLVRDGRTDPATGYSTDSENGQEPRTGRSDSSSD